MFDHLLKSSWRDDSNKWFNIGFGEESTILEIKIRTISVALSQSGVKLSMLIKNIYYNIFIISQPHPFLRNLLEWSQRDDSDDYTSYDLDKR